MFGTSSRVDSKYQGLWFYLRSNDHHLRGEDLGRVRLQSCGNFFCLQRHPSILLYATVAQEGREGVDCCKVPLECGVVRCGLHLLNIGSMAFRDIYEQLL